MNAVKPTPFTTPDGVQRELRSTPGARKLIVDLTGMQLKPALDKYDSGAYPEILFALLHDSKGNPPDGITVEYLRWNLSDSDGVEIMASIMAAYSNGKLEKKDLEPMLKKAMSAETGTGSKSGASAPSSSESPTNNSGGDTLSVSLTPESSATPSTNDSGISASA